jgi:hypothetical protein
MDMIANIFLFLNDGRSTYCAYLIMSKSYHISQGGFKAVQDEAPGYSRIVIIFNYVIFRSGCRFCGTFSKFVSSTPSTLCIASTSFVLLNLPPYSIPFR